MIRPRKRRARHTQEQRAAIVAGQARSGLTQREFCRREGLSLSTFTQWRRAAKPRETPAAPFAQVHLSTPLSGCAVTLHLPSGARLEVADGSDAMWRGLGLLLQSLAR